MTTQLKTEDYVLNSYYEDMGTEPLLNKEEEKQLFKRYRTCSSCGIDLDWSSKVTNCPDCGTPRDMAARDQLVRCVLRYSLKVAKSYARKSYGGNYKTNQLKPLISAGNLGVLIAIDRFDPARDFRFITYAAYWIYERIFDALNHTELVYVPTRKRATNKIEIEHIGSGCTLDYDALPIQTAPDTTSCFEQKDILNKALTSGLFSNQDVDILKLSYGLEGKPQSLKKIAEKLNMSVESIRQTRKAILLKLKTYMTSQGHSLDELLG